MQIKNGNGWQDIGLLGPKDGRVSLNDYKAGHEVYAVQCGENGKYSQIIKLRGGADTRNSNKNSAQSERFDTLRLLRKYDSHELNIVAFDGTPVTIRLTHM